ncbi:GNAT family N-acetyltransferase [Microlunatus sp. GCM10028923]|uniref:GNAT family N-acetyltransferase n=1 Tax=Microlunatus sp. GCM10028923 TaxID=3273400 RepID=UPI00360A5573
MTAPLIRLASSDDAPHLAALRRSYGTERHPGSDPDPDFERRFSEWHDQTQDSCVTWLAVAETQPVGILSMFVFPRMPMPGREVGRLAYLSLLYVTPDHRNHGLGRQLLDVAFAYSYANDIFKILLRPTDQALALYQRAGFRFADQYLVWSSADQARA